MATTVIFGSSITSTTPRDIDVAYTGRWSRERNDRVMAWATTMGVQDTPIELHAKANGQIVLPSPCGKEVRFVVLEGDRADVQIKVFGTLSAALRAYGHDSDLFMKKLEEGNIETRVAMLPPNAPDYYQDGSGWDKYCEGLKALQSALRHAPSWPEIAARLENGDLLWQIAGGNLPECENPNRGLPPYGWSLSEWVDFRPL